ncbi:hypothetical protein M422DRAFT_784520 [Sphaerobolus stellatus SS14]|uniref:Uncharacterized protein n=1 Tax=Sphaerobolus stellatus (strain SS14) TaxID=990650 RepID=A0A0C9U368_SPHS4|nr:hypothetical protein M422DRAFT_784520 [Sphaerobolus stellatus SS14]
MGYIIKQCFPFRYLRQLPSHELYVPLRRDYVNSRGPYVTRITAVDSPRTTLPNPLKVQWCSMENGSYPLIYPVVTIKPAFDGRGQAVTWNVHIKSNSDLAESNTGLDVSYLFWAVQYALTRTEGCSLSLTPPASPTLGESKLEVEHFNPITPDLTPSDSGLLPIQDVTSYLDSALKVLGLHTEARTSFITYWLLSLLKHKHVALRFLPQMAYERAALLDVSPRPNIIMRVFMLFKGVNDDELESSWNHAVQRASRDVDFWVDVVGVDIRRATDFSLFRVLERGGMEALWHYFILPVTDIESQLARTCIF